ncbi:MAG: alpha/beta fold hydrolase [Betaproteobacteria bacterium]|nr:alpha/beta fold hydrolase [Betaproteobacteria bacterium]
MPPQAFDQQMLDTGDGHRLYLAQYGKPSAPAAVVLHGGPGSGTSPSVLEWFDLSRQRVVLFDQRGAGQSVPHGELQNNDSQRLVGDIELIRTRLGIEQWMVVGGSWGATLALMYAASHAEHIRGMVLRGSFLASARELYWFFQSLRAMVPQAWAQMTHGWNEAQQADVLRTLSHALLSSDTAQAHDAARRWSHYESALMRAMEGKLDTPAASSKSQDAAKQQEPVAERTLGKYRLQAHYLSQHCFCTEADLLEAAAAMHDEPMVIIHGTHDLICPPENAIKLKAANPQARLVWVERGTHTPADPLIASALTDAIAGLRQSNR